MATNAYIGLQCGNSVSAIYCHFDGYLGHTGQMLKEHYSDIDSITKLIELGSISYLGSTIGKKVDFKEYNSVPAMLARDKNNEESQTLAYHRDRGEPLEIYKGTLEEYRELCHDYDYIYLFDHGWKYMTSAMENFESF